MATTKATTTARKGMGNTPATTGPVTPANLAGVVTAPAATTAPKATTKAAATTTAPAATPVARTTSAGAKAAKALAWLVAHQGGHAVKDIEAGCGYPVKTLAGVLGRMAATPGSGVVRVGVPMGGRVYQGFAAATPAATKPATKRAPKATK